VPRPRPHYGGVIAHAQHGAASAVREVAADQLEFCVHDGVISD
jgi:hypothetical protein